MFSRTVSPSLGSDTEKKKVLAAGEQEERLESFNEIKPELSH